MLNKLLKLKIKKNSLLNLITVFIFLFSINETYFYSIAESQEYINIQRNENLISAKIEEASLREVLWKLSEIFPLEINFKGSPPQKIISLNFYNLQIQEGIEQILEGESYVILKFDYYKEYPLKIVIHPSASTSNCTPEEDLFKRDSDPPLNKIKCYILRGINPQLRFSALEALLDRGEEKEIREILAQMTVDPNLQIKEFAYRLLVETEEFN